tara:strand:- start:859 stop:1341 length:483 start_codon:yes stop_codon:yes gene_type:complete
MALDVKIKTNAKHIEKRFNRLKSKFPSIIDKGILQAGFQLLDIIRTKTARGIDVNSTKFAPYSSSYLKKLNREGKKTAVDLFYSGRMLSALTPSGKTVRKTGKHKVSLGFSNAQMRQRALFNQVLNEPKRVFFGFNDRTEKIIQNTFNKFVKKQFRNMKI